MYCSNVLQIEVGTKYTRFQSAGLPVHRAVIVKALQYAGGQHHLQPVEPPGFCNRGKVRYGSIGV